MPTAAPVVLIDMDNVIADLNGDFWVKWEQQFPAGPSRDLADVTQFELWDQVPADWAERAKEQLAIAGNVRHLNVIDGAHEALHLMVERGWNVQLCSTPYLRNPTAGNDKLAWLAERFGETWPRRLNLTQDKTLVRGVVLVDDKAAVTGAMTPQWKHVVFDAPNNQRSTATLRLRGWEQWRDVLIPAVEGR